MNFAACFEKSRHLLLEGALGERLKREYGLKIDGTAAMAPLVYDPQAQKALAALWAVYRGIAQEYGLPFLATTPTRRANRERAALAGEEPDPLEKIRGALTPEEFRFLKRLVIDKAGHREVAGEFGITLWASQKRLERIRAKLNEIFPEWRKKK